MNYLSIWIDGSGWDQDGMRWIRMDEMDQDGMDGMDGWDGWMGWMDQDGMRWMDQDGWDGWDGSGWMRQDLLPEAVVRPAKPAAGPSAFAPRNATSTSSVPAPSSSPSLGKPGWNHINHSLRPLW